MKAEAENQASSEAAASDPEAAKQEARSMLEAGSTIEEIEAATGLGRNQILGIKGSMAKAQKKLDKAQGEFPLQTGKSNSDEEGLVGDFQKETKISNSALALSRSQARLRNLDPNSYKDLYGTQPGQSEVGPASKLIDLEIIRQLRDMRLSEEHRNNGGGAEATETLNLRKEVDALREEIRKKDVEALKKETEKLEGQIVELRADLRSSAGSNSDLAVVVRETSNLIGKALESPGPLRNYLVPADAYIKDKAEAPLLHQQTGLGTRSVVSELSKRGLVTKIIERDS